MLCLIPNGLKKTNDAQEEMTLGKSVIVGFVIIYGVKTLENVLL